MSYEEKVKELTPEEKAKLLSGAKNMETYAIPRLGIPSLKLSDGPLGVRKEDPNAGAVSGVDHTLPSTCFPVGANLGNTWSPALLNEMGKALGKEAKYYDVDILLGPAINIKRNPLNGRNFEYYSEDPILTGKLAISYIEGLQGEGVGACVKHYALNNNESFRFSSDSLCEERVMREIYLRPFQMAIRHAHPGSLMTGYNQVNSAFCCQNDYLLQEVLRKEWGFDGLVMSDWGGTEDRVEALKEGMDLEMPGCIEENPEKVEEAVKKDSLLAQREEESDRRILRALDKASKVDKSVKDKSIFEEDDKLAYRIALESMVLLKNENNTLPLFKEEKVLILGSPFKEEHYQGGGSSMIHSYKKETLEEVFQKRGISYTYEEGYQEREKEPNPKLEKKALEAATKADTILLFLGERGTDDSEGYDRKSIKLPKNQISLLEKIPSGKRIIVLLYGGGVMEIPCLEKINALLYCGLPGQEGGNALVSLLLGEENPSGKLAESFYQSYEEVPYGKEFKPQLTYLYKEGLFVGYREAKEGSKKFAFPFGYGLSYTIFSYSDLEVKQEEDSVLVSYTVKNTGNREGKEISEVYVGKKDSSLLRPIRELKGFSKDNLKPSEEKRIEVRIPFSALKVYVPQKKEFVLEDGTYAIYVGSSSESLILQKEISIAGEKMDEEISLALKEKMLSYSLTDEEFYSLLEREKKDDTITKPYTLETPIAYFNTSFGKKFRKMTVWVGKHKVKKAKHIKDPEQRGREEKAGVFIAELMPYNSLRSLSFSSAGSFSYKVAEGVLEMVNGHFFKGLHKMMAKKGK
ncbi:MAG: glycoside hydrolase family 3 C-terminal domain-containing protein [Eubacteriales bacterium]|nr:glycoside hydrolase family 3 C-terminal domain-containing protein [Eubacteriales bacterium]